MEKKKITSYHDLEVYQRAYNACLIVMKDIVPKLPDAEKFDLKNQVSRSSKTIPRLIAEGFAKKHQKAGFQKYLDDAMAESNETQVSVCQSKDIYPTFVDIKIYDQLIIEYDIISKQLYRLREAWSKFSKPQDQKPSTNN
ncbi:MAG: four helix bundle protein [Chitinophagaceae bacterium]